jgi:hypothetical protein
VKTRLKGYKYFEIERDFFKVDPKEEASVVEVFQDVLDKLSDVGKKDKLLKFFKLVQDGKFPLHNIAFELFLDMVELKEIFLINLVSLLMGILNLVYCYLFLFVSLAIYIEMFFFL